MSQENLPFSEFARLMDGLCPVAHDLAESLMHKINELRTLARSCERQKRHQAGMAYDDMGDELVLMLEAFLKRTNAPEEPPCPNPEHN